MDKSGCFFKTLPTKGLARKGKKTVKMEESQSKKWQLRFSLVPMVVKLASQYYPEIKKARCFKRTSDASKLEEVS